MYDYDRCNHGDIHKTVIIRTTALFPLQLAFCYYILQYLLRCQRFRHNQCCRPADFALLSSPALLLTSLVSSFEEQFKQNICISLSTPLGKLFDTEMSEP